ncbi:hypothetical protein [Hyperthermus butylicus]|nr:hypothetical protein [Hyperthermus butylicus]
MANQFIRIILRGRGITVLVPKERFNERVWRFIAQYLPENIEIQEV